RERFAVLCKRRVCFRLGRRGDVAWLLDHWMHDHLSGWPESAVTVADVPLRRWVSAAYSLRRLGEERDARPLVVMAPARRRGRLRLVALWPTAETLARAARPAFPGSIITVEPFGNERVRSVLAAGALVSSLPPIELDRHDDSAPMAWVLTVEAPPGQRGRRCREGADGRGASGDLATGLVERAPRAVD
ncbi:MAG: hypothetical protein ABW219_13675, partial [Ilumatobacteraceae bacterium]